MSIPLEEIAALVSGQVIGDASLCCEGANPPTEVADGQITMLDDVRHLSALGASAAIAVVTPEKVDLPQAQIVVEHPHTAFAKIVALFRPPIDDHVPEVGVDPSAKIDPTAIVHPSATIGAGVSIGPRTLIMPGVVVMPECRIGSDCLIHANVTLYQYTQIEDRVLIHAGAVVGANGFGYRNESGKHVLTAQLGYVHIESDVDVGASTTIDRGTYGATRIGEGTKIDNQVMIAHNCRIGRHNLICSQVGIAGSCQTGDYVILAGQVGLKDHVSLGDKSIVGAQAGVMDDCPGDEVYLGSPATTQREQMQIMAVERRLPEMRRELKKLRKDIGEMQQTLAESPDQSERPDQRAA